VGEAGDRALFVDPYYATYPGTIRGAGLVPVAVRGAGGGRVRAARRGHCGGGGGRCRCCSIRPTTHGGGLSEAALREIAEVARAKDLWLISDEVYDTQVWEGAHVSPRALPGMAERVLVVGSMSKSHAMTGSRVGWIVGPRRRWRRWAC
jgi:arginine:pyruvate transaminase